MRCTRQKSAILRRSPALEYALLGLLIVLRLIEDSIKHNRIGLESIILTALISLAVFEPIARSTFIVMKYRTQRRVLERDRRRRRAPAVDVSPEPARETCN